MRVTNEEIADVLERTADLLQAQHADPYRVRAYRRASTTCRSHPKPLRKLDRVALEALPTIGKSIASSILEFTHDGRLRMLDRLEGQVSPEDLFTTLPGVGDEMAHRIHDELHVETLEELEVAAHDGRLEQVDGIGPRRARAIRDELDAILRRSSRRRARRVREQEHVREHARDEHEPSVATLLAVDELYRRKARAHELRTIAPRRFNPTGAAWLPVLHAERDGWYFTALYSNTARAHQLEKIGDWVVLIFERDGHEGQRTVVTERRGPLRGRRVVRGREAEVLALGLEGEPHAEPRS